MTRLLYPTATQDEIAALSPGDVALKLSSLMDELKSARLLTGAAWRKNTHSG